LFVLMLIKQKLHTISSESITVCLLNAIINKTISMLQLISIIIHLNNDYILYAWNFY